MPQRALVIPISMRPHSSSSLPSALKQLQSCTTRGPRPQAIFLVLLGTDCNSESSCDPQLVREVIQTLQRIRQPVVGVATASVCHEATEVLQRCDYVLSSDDASFWLKERCISAAEAVAQGVAQRILPVADIGWEMAMLAKQLQVMTAAELASIKVNWLCAKASQVLTSPIKAQQPADSDRFAGTEVLLARPDVAKKESRSFWRSLTASTIPEIDEDEEAEEEEDEGMSSTASACSQATRSFTGDSAMTSADTGCTPQ